ncbi:hypothetical protein Tco_0681534 [Tanacetum coccineum]|uniref:Uncharacterized protein n=1 Tax=Tanacetum coccineum TaxID=301880 RepID=A0ABQ4XQA2_9ASTR
MVAYLKKPTGSEGFQEIVDFLNGSPIRYALTKNPTIYVSLIEKFWQTATVRIVDNGEQEITATVDGKEFTITEASVRRHLQLADVDSISVLPTIEIFDQLSLIGYVLTNDKLTFQKGKFSPQWIFLIHTILYCLSPKKTSCEQFSSNIATAIICLATNNTLNFSKLIFDGMVKNLDTKYKFLMYPRFIQIFLDKNKRFLNPHNRKYIAPALTPKLFSNMKRGFSKEHTPLFPCMIAIQAEEGEGSGHPFEPQLPPSTAQPTNKEPIHNVVSSSHQKTQTPRQALNQVTKLPRTSEPIPNVSDEAVYEEWNDRVERATTTAASLDAEQASGNINRTQSMAMPNVPLPQGIGVVNTLRSDEGSMTLQELMVLCTTLSKKVESLEADLKQTKKGRMIKEIDQDAGVTLVTPTHSQEDQPEDQLGVFSTTKEEWENIRVRVKADEELSRRLQAEERNKYSEVNQAKMLQLKRYSFDEFKELFETIMKNVHTFVPMETEDRGRASELAAGSSQETIIDSAEVRSTKKDAEAELDHECSKRQKTNEASGSVQEQPEEEEKDLSQEDLEQMMMVVSVEEVYVEALHVKYPIIDWEVYTEESRKYWKIIRNLVKERFSSTEPTDDKERALWVELKRLLVEQHSEMANELLRKIFMQAIRPRQ